MQTKHVRDFMTEHYATVTLDQSLASAVRTILECHQTAVPVINEQRQLVAYYPKPTVCAQPWLKATTTNIALAKDLMSTKLGTVSPDAELNAVFEIFLNNNRRVMPVVEAGNLVGLLPRHNILKALVKEL